MLRNLSPKLSLLIRLVLVALALTASPATVAHAEAIAVTTQDDSLDAAGGVCGDMTPKNIATTGDGLVSLREAVCAANNTPDADSIFLPAGTYMLTLIGHSDDDNLTGDLDIKADGGNLTIYHDGPGQAIISGVGAAVPGDRVLHIDPTRTGGITITISGVAVQNGGYTLGSGPGGGLFIMGDNTVNITDCAIKHNRVVTAAGSGGGIYNDGATINITDTSISFNEVIAAANYARGGGIYNTSGGTVNLTSSTIYSNTVSVVYGSECEAYGGGIYSWFSPVNVTDSTISENRAITTGTGGVCGRGGGIYSYDARVSLADGTHLTGNTANAEGGGFYNYKGTLTANDATIADNEAGQSGWGGGGVFSEQGEVTIDDSTIAGNKAGYDGGGIFANAYPTSTMTMTISNSTISNNNSDGYGGGIAAIAASSGDIMSLTLNHVTVTDNTSAEDGGGIYLYDGSADLADVTVSGNSADFYGGGLSLSYSSAAFTRTTVSDNSASDNGGGIRFYRSSADLADVTISGNSAGFGGGGVYLDLSSVTLTRTTVWGNSAANDGGGIYLYYGLADIIEVTILDNAAVNDGGGIYSLGSSSAVTITNSVIHRNIVGSTGVGGGIASEDGSVFIVNSTLSANRADYGGGINVDESSAYLSHVTITDNTADDDNSGTGYGGGIYCNTDGTVHHKNSIIVGNHANSGAHTSDCGIEGTFNSHGYNLVGSGTGCPSYGTGDQTTTDPRLGPLADNGGSTQTHALLSSSPAIDAVINCYDLQGNLITTDQRGQPRPLDGDMDGTALCDIGAYEFGVTVYLPLVLRGY